MVVYGPKVGRYGLPVTYSFPVSPLNRRKDCLVLDTLPTPVVDVTVDGPVLDTPVRIEVVGVTTDRVPSGLWIH